LGRLIRLTENPEPGITEKPVGISSLFAQKSFPLRLRAEENSLSGATNHLPV
jgi:hypothetical protein